MDAGKSLQIVNNTFIEKFIKIKEPQAVIWKAIKEILKPDSLVFSVN